MGKQGQSRKKATNKEYGRRGKYAKGNKKAGRRRRTRRSRRRRSR